MPHGTLEIDVRDIWVLVVHVSLLHFVRHDIPDPGHDTVHAAVDAGKVGIRAALTPGRDSPQHEAAFFFAHQRSSAVALARVCDTTVGAAGRAEHGPSDYVLRLGVICLAHLAAEERDRRLLQYVRGRSGGAKGAPARDATLRPPLALGRGQAGRSNALIQRNRLVKVQQSEVVVVRDVLFVHRMPEDLFHKAFDAHASIHLHLEITLPSAGSDLQSTNFAGTADVGDAVRRCQHPTRRDQRSATELAHAGIANAHLPPPNTLPCVAAVDDLGRCMRDVPAFSDTPRHATLLKVWLRLLGPPQGGLCCFVVGPCQPDQGHKPRKGHH
mmetsp:Transcript_97240/g.135088  ORF Transcript_97240/g.135088 Transcript_97240/m.135088 type:complete len:327 (-) Transcript_97240:32-1012(-)